MPVEHQIGGMPMSPYVRELRARLGKTRLLLPSVSAHIFDSTQRLLLVRERDGGVWSTPGGAIEPDERPADCVVRETWEETGLLVSPKRLLAIYGGPEFIVRYANGDETQYVIAAFGCDVLGGSLRDETDETIESGYFSQSEAGALPLTPWLRAALVAVFSPDLGFAAPRWRPPAGK